MFGYDYPPSAQILTFGPLVKESHYVAKGTATYDVGEIDCTFEVAVTQYSQVVAICYLDHNDLYRVTSQEVDSGNDAFRMSIDRRANLVSLDGNDLFRGYSVKVDGLVHVGGRESLFSHVKDAKPSYLKFLCQSYVVSTGGDVENWPHYSICNLDFYDAYFTFQNRKNFEFKLNFSADRIINLLPQIPIDEREYPQQITAKLAISENTATEDWTTEQLADTWCALASLALGRDIQWIHKEIPYSEHIWQSKRMNVEGQGHELIANSRVEMGSLISARNLLPFMQTMFSSIESMESSPEKILSYLKKVHRYIQYCSDQTMSVEGKLLLVSVLIEELTREWQDSHKVKPQKLLLRSERDKLTKLIWDYIESSADQFLSEENIPNLQEIADKAANAVRLTLLDDTFAERLQAIFAYQKYAPIKGQIDIRIKEFIRTRNSLVHYGLLHTSRINQEKNRYDESELIKRIEQEYWNTIMMFPIMIFAIFGYEGEYRDKYFEIEDKGGA